MIKATKENLGQIAKNIGLSLLPAPISALIITIEDIKTEDELKERFSELKKYAAQIKKSVPVMPISVEIELVSVVIIYVNEELDSETVANLESDLKQKQIDFECEGADEFILESDYIAVNLSDPTDKEEVKEIVECVRGTLQDYGIQIKAIAYI